MSQSFAQVYLHIVFSTKHRQPFLTDAGVRADCHAYLAGAYANRGCPSLIVGGAEDHVHILCMLGRQEEIAVLVREIKRESRAGSQALHRGADGAPQEGDIPGRVTGGCWPSTASNTTSGTCGHEAPDVFSG